MTHASVELIRAMLGEAPAFLTSRMEKGDWNRPCRQIGGEAVFAVNGGSSSEHTPIVTCPRCLVAMDAAREGRALT